MIPLSMMCSGVLFYVCLAAHVANGCKSQIRPSSVKDTARTKGDLVNGMFKRTEIGMPQGGPLSPLLSNIMLNELDKELERRGHRFVRYADDCMIFCKSRK